MASVDACPTNQTKVIEASKMLGCGNDLYSNNQYLCLPNVNKTSLVEFCYDGLMGLQEKGFCLQASDGNLTHTSCIGFRSGCPETPYITSDFYKYSACQELNLDHHCYKYDPHCPPKTDVETNDTPTTISILVVFLGLAVIFIVSFCILFFCRQKLRQLCNGKKGRNETGQFLSPDRTDDENMPFDPQKTAMTTYDEDNQKRNAVSSEKAISNKGDNTKEADIAEDIKNKQMEKETTGSHNISSDGETLTDGQGQSTDIMENTKSEESKKKTMGSHDKSSDGDTLTERHGQNSNEADTAENVKREQKEKMTMGSDDKSSDGDTLTKRQGQNSKEENTAEKSKKETLV